MFTWTAELLVAVGTIVAAAAGYVAWRRHQDGLKAPLPPMAPYSLLSNVRRSGYVSLAHKVECTKWVEQHTTQDTSHGATFQLRMPLPFPFITTADHKLSRLVLSGSADGKTKEAEKSPSNSNLNLIPGVFNILSYPTGDPHRGKARKFVAPSFSTANLQKHTMHVLYAKTVRLMAERLNGSLNGTPTAVNMREESVRVIFDVLVESLFDLPMTSGGDSTGERQGQLGGIEGFSCDAFRDASDCSLREAMQETNNPFRRYMFWSEARKKGVRSRDQMVQWGKAVLERYRAKHENSDSKDMDSTILGHLMRHEYPSDEHRASDLVVMLIAGHETTAHSLSFLLLCMARDGNRHALRRLQAELDKAFPALDLSRAPADGGSSGDSAVQQVVQHAVDAYPLSAVSALPYFAACVKEVQRLFPVAPVVGRQLTEEMEHNGMRLPRRSVVAVHMYAMGRQEWIHRADEFIPERWLDNERKDWDGKEGECRLTTEDFVAFASQLPALKELDQINSFSAGKRSCIGQNLAMLELRLMGAMLLRNFSFAVQSEPTLELFITLKPVELMMQVQRRK